MVKSALQRNRPMACYPGRELSTASRELRRHTFATRNHYEASLAGHRSLLVLFFFLNHGGASSELIVTVADDHRRWDGQGDGSITDATPGPAVLARLRCSTGMNATEG